MVSGMHYLTFEVFENIDITTNFDPDQSIKYTQCILAERALNLFLQDKKRKQLYDMLEICGLQSSKGGEKVGHLDLSEAGQVGLLQ